MTRQQVFDMVAEAINNNEFECIHLIERGEAKNIVITLDRNLYAYVNEDGTAQIIVKGNPHMLTGIKRQTLIDLSIEGKAAAEEKARMQELQEMREKLPLWKEQCAVLETKIREAEQKMAVKKEETVEQEVPAPDKTGRRWWHKVFSTEGKQ